MNSSLEALEEYAHTGSWTLNLTTEEVWWSVGTYRIHGIPPGSNTPTLATALSFIHPDSRTPLQEAIQRTVEDGLEYGVYLTVVQPSGAEVRVFSSGRPIYEGSKLQGLAGMLFNLDAMQATEASRRVTSGQLAVLIGTAPHGLVMTDAGDHITRANPAFCKMLGYDEEELLGQLITSVVHEDDHTKTALDRHALWSGALDHSSAEKRYIHRDGHAIWTQVSFSILRSDSREPLNYIRQVQDITERREQADALYEAKELAQVTLGSIADGVIRTDLDAIVTYCNDAAAAMLKRAPEQIVGQAFSACMLLTNASGEALANDPIDYVLKTGLTSRVSSFARMQSADGDSFPIHDSVSPLRNRDGELKGTVFVFQDASESYASTTRLAHQASHDLLTGLPNRMAAEKRIAQLLVERPMDERQHFLFFLDLDHFKIVNDTSGHLAGDLMVKEIGNLVSAILRSGDMFARFGGDEFLLVLPNATTEAATRIAQRVLELVAKHPFRYGDREYQLSVSIGITPIDGDAQNLAHVLAAADAACYTAKSQVRGSFHMHSTTDRQTSLAYDDLSWSNRIRHAIENDSFELFGQQIVDAQGHLLGVECLIRMRNSDKGYFPPAQFLPAAERMGVMAQLDRWIFKSGIEMVCSSANNPAFAKELGGYLTLNLSARTLSNSDFVSWALNEFEKCSDNCRRLRIEITETEKGAWGSEEIAAIDAFRNLGIRVLLDDFGMGYNSFEVLKQVTFDGIKLDRQVVKDIEVDPVDKALAIASVAIAKDLNIQLVAEGVETVSVLHALQDLGVTCFQGHLFHIAAPFQVDFRKSADSQLTAAPLS